MKKLIVVLVVVSFLFCSSFAFADGDGKNMEKWSGVSRIDSSVGVKVVFKPEENKTSYHGNIIVYPLMWTNENGANLLGAGYKGNYWESSSGHEQRHLGQAAIRGYREWGNIRLSILGGVQNGSYGTSNPRYNLYGIGGYLSLNHKEDSSGESSFPETNLWFQALKADGQNSQSTTTGIIDIGGRQYLYEGFIKPFIEANLSLGTPNTFASLGIGIGVEDERKIFILSAGLYWNLRHGGAPTFINAGLDPNNLALAFIKHNARNRVQEVKEIP